MNIKEGRPSPRATDSTAAVMAMYRLVQNMKSWGFGSMPSYAAFFFNRFCTPPERNAAEPRAMEIDLSPYE